MAGVGRRAMRRAMAMRRVGLGIPGARASQQRRRRG